MAIQIQDAAGNLSKIDGTTFNAQRMVSKPIDHGAFGHYRVSVAIPLLAAQALNGTLFSCRWGDATRLMVLQYLRMELIQTAAATATIMPNFEAFIARSFTVADSVGTAVTLTTPNMKKRANMGATLLSDMRYSAAAAGLTVGTRTLDAQPLIQMPTNQTITTPNAIIYSKELNLTNSIDHPVVLVQNEGLVIRGPSVAFGVAGTANLLLDMCWAEVAAY